MDDLVDRLPDRLLEITPEVVEGNMIGLGSYINDLDDWLRVEMRLPASTDVRANGRGYPPVAEVMTLIGAEPAEWYRHLLGQ